MTFRDDHYVPVLKLKRGEKHALRSLSSSVVARITPLLEIVERKPKNALDRHLETAFDDLGTSVLPFERFFLDTHEIEPDGVNASRAVFAQAADELMAFVPVIHLSCQAGLTAALEHRDRGLAIRVTRPEFEGGNWDHSLQAFMAAHRLSPNNVDLIVDLGGAENMIAEGVMALTEQFLGGTPEPASWRTLILSGSAFPQSMGVIKRNAHGRVPRSEWIAWRDGLYLNRDSIPRLPTYSDCAIQHPSGVENFDPRTMQGSAAVRYTEGDDWLLIKGVGTKVMPPSVQFPKLAAKLVSGSLKGAYQSAAHCEGCSSMKRAAEGAPKLGSLEAWRRLGTIHHMTTVVDQLSALAEP